MDNLTDEELYDALIKQQDQRALKKIYERYSGPLFRFIYRFTLNRQAAEDLLQDIFEQLLAGKFSGDSGANVKSWLFTLAKNKSLNFVKKASFETLAPSVLEKAQDQADLENSLIGENLQIKLSLATNQLPPDLLQVWQLRKNSYDYKEIAVRLSIPVGTVKSRFHRLVEFLKKEILE
jgi:RNA polymerase sigma-70 factor (ECF subfamily)